MLDLTSLFYFHGNRTTMTRSTDPRVVRRRRHHYRPKKVNIKELLPKPKPVEISPRVIYVQSPYYEQMEATW